jgi:biotin carboxyl carrier protein
MGRALGEDAQMRYIATIDNKEFIVEIIDSKHVSVNGQTLSVDFESINGQPVYSLIIDGKSYEGYVYPDENDWQVLLHGRLHHAVVEDEREKRLRAAAGGVAASGEFHLKAPMPGMVISIPVTEGQVVKKGQVLLILESMKMQNELKSPKDGTVARIRIKAGEAAEQKQALMSVI